MSLSRSSFKLLPRRTRGETRSPPYPVSSRFRRKGTGNDRKRRPLRLYARLACAGRFVSASAPRQTGLLFPSDFLRYASDSKDLPQDFGSEKKTCRKRGTAASPS